MTNATAQRKNVGFQVTSNIHKGFGQNPQSKDDC